MAQPNYNLAYLNKKTDERGKVGVGWANPNGSITVKLNPCVVLSAVDLRECVLTLFPNDRRDDYNGHPGGLADSGTRQDNADGPVRDAAGQD